MDASPKNMSFVHHADPNWVSDSGCAHYWTLTASGAQLIPEHRCCNWFAIGHIHLTFNGMVNGTYFAELNLKL